MVKGDKRQWKARFFDKLKGFLEEYPKIMIVGVDNVGSNQMQQIRMKLRGHAELLVGKNTMIRRALRILGEDNEQLLGLLPHVAGNVGFVFTDKELTYVRDLMMENKVQAPAKAGAIAPVNVTIPAGNSGLGPEKTSFFQALAIPTKIARGTIEILSDITLLKIGEKVGASESALLNMMKISPFQYGLILQQVYDNGSVYDPEVLDITDDIIKAKFLAGAANVAAVSLSIGYPTKASAPHSIINGFKNLLAVAVATEIDFPQAESIKAYLKDPSAFAVAAPAAAAAAEEAPKAPEPESESESGDDDGFSLFD